MDARSLATTATLAVAVLLLGACGDDDAAPAPADLPASYRFVVSSTCGERSFIGTFAVVVRDGRVTQVDNTGDSADYYRPRPDDVPTLADLLDAVDTAEPDAVVELEQDADGVPTWVSIDHDPAAIDDEECYRITEYEPLPG